MNNLAKEAYNAATNIMRIYTRLGVARDVLALALDEAPLGFDPEQFKRINDLRNAISKEMGLLNDFSKREAHRLCHPENFHTTPDPNYKLLTNGDIIQHNDQWLEDNEWKPFSLYSNTLGTPFRADTNTPVRRLIKPHTPPEQLADSQPADDHTGLEMLNSDQLPPPDQNQFPPLADPDSLPDPPVLAGPDDNTPNFVQVSFQDFF